MKIRREDYIKSLRPYPTRGQIGALLSKLNTETVPPNDNLSPDQGTVRNETGPTSECPTRDNPPGPNDLQSNPASALEVNQKGPEVSYPGGQQERGPGRVPVVRSVGPGPGSVPRSSVTLSEASKRLIQKQLVLLLHAHACQKKAFQLEKVPKPCPVPNCEMMKDVWRHMKGCGSGMDCAYQHCTSSNKILSHWKNCKFVGCPVCHLVRIKGAEFIKNRQRQLLQSQSDPSIPPPRSNPHEPIRLVGTDYAHFTSQCQGQCQGAGSDNRRAVWTSQNNQLYRDHNKQLQLQQQHTSTNFNCNPNYKSDCNICPTNLQQEQGNPHRYYQVREGQQCVNACNLPQNQYYLSPQLHQNSIQSQQQYQPFQHDSPQYPHPLLQSQVSSPGTPKPAGNDQKHSPTVLETTSKLQYNGDAWGDHKKSESSLPERKGPELGPTPIEHDAVNELPEPHPRSQDPEGVAVDPLTAQHKYDASGISIFKIVVRNNEALESFRLKRWEKSDRDDEKGDREGHGPKAGDLLPVPSASEVKRAYELLGIPCPKEALHRLMATLPGGPSTIGDTLPLKEEVQNDKSCSEDSDDGIHLENSCSSFSDEQQSHSPLYWTPFTAS